MHVQALTCMELAALASQPQISVVVAAQALRVIGSWPLAQVVPQAFTPFHTSLTSLELRMPSSYLHGPGMASLARLSSLKSMIMKVSAGCSRKLPQQVHMFLASVCICLTCQSLFFTHCPSSRLTTPLSSSCFSCRHAYVSYASLCACPVSLCAAQIGCLQEDALRSLAACAQLEVVKVEFEHVAPVGGGRTAVASHPAEGPAPAGPRVAAPEEATRHVPDRKLTFG